ncbi:GNAT family N-acetyltransferase [Streptomyces sp. NBC_01465]|uniref:GNAT family N-acetyltransferase n=1 Tax=Streptomyces sp. NBC_01465 TaxID=2903878 RepID=UPI002E3012BF|nr:GNAT family N-acetyltransferase [Streptomyces sp. NBC_01465]
MDLTIRRAEPEEYEPLGDLTAAAYLHAGFLDLGEDDPYLDTLRDVPARAIGAEVLVAVRETELLGGVTYAPPGSPWADIAGPHEAEFRTLAVAPDARGQGVGEALVRACIDRARAASHVENLVLSTQRTMLGAHRIYHRLGFTRTPERDWAPVPNVSLLTYSLKL